MVARILFMLFLSLVIGHCYGGNSKTIEVILDKNDFSIINKDGVAYFTSDKYFLSYCGEISTPALPYININILIGENEEYDSFTYYMSEEKCLEDVEIENNEAEIPANVSFVSLAKSSISYTINSFPEIPIEYTGTHNADGYKYISFLVSPFRYDVIEKTLFFKNSITVLLKTNRKTHNMDSFYRIPQERIKEIVINGDEIPLLYPSVQKARAKSNSTGVQFDYVIITNDSLKNAFLKLANWKTTKGIRTKVITTEEIYSTYTGTSNQEKIKNALKYYYDNSANFKYVLLGGDIDVVPTQMCIIEYRPKDTVYYVEFCPTDLYYANFSTMNWDANGNGVFGELADIASPYPEIAITRAPVDSYSDAEIFVNRIIEYETNPKTDGWNRNILMCGNVLVNYYSYNGVIMSDAHYKGERFHQKYIAEDWDGDKVAFYDTGTDFLGGASYAFGPQNIQKQLSKGYTFVNVITHGSPIALQTEESNYTVSYADTLRNDGHSIIITSACLTNAFDSIPKCLSEAFIRNPNSGIVSYFGCSREGWISPSQYQFGTSSRVNSKLYKNIFEGNDKSYGEVVRKTKEDIVSLCSRLNLAYRWLLFGLNPIGDPEMPIVIDTLKNFSDVTISFSNGTLSVNTGVNDCKICVVSAYDMGDSYYDVRSGSNAVFNNLADDYSICITKNGYVPYVARCGNNVYIQNQYIEKDFEVYSNKTCVGGDVTTFLPNGPVEISNGKTIIHGNNGVTLKNNFNVKIGASLEIRTE